MEASPSLSNMPHEIIRIILLQLPVKCVIRCQCVCKQWRSLIDDSDFKFSYRRQRRLIFFSFESISKDRNRRWMCNIYRFFVRSTSHDLRLRRHKLPFGQGFPLIRTGLDLSVLGSCNGFVLLLVANKDIWLWNPSTKCSTKVLELPYPEKLDPVIFAAGLCYDSCTRDYKVVLLLHRHLIQSNHDFSGPFVRHLFLISASLNHKEWRPVQFPCNLDSVRGGFGGLEFRNTFHWWASDTKDWDWDRDYLSGRNRIIYFDPVGDKFRILPLPTSEPRENFSIFGLGVIDDCFCMAACMDKEEPKTLTVWIMKEYGRQESWMIAFALQMPQAFGDIYWMYGFTFYSQNKNAQEVLFLHTDGFLGRIIYVYDREKDEFKIDLLDFLPSTFSICFYVESLECPDRPQWIWRGDDDDDDESVQNINWPR
ncbi:PREDICTED: F-box/kelch-repeat protein At3g23880-like [Ipomoea nil]|uniref:F-box/kelch-repeat protein At3g23880-like n=1 Tax=Ipomoea nil TaxID=35883 RepID=UPI00090091DE|nr:PREDICTED: F-box/kelch-repeat protein At3g23880-like [Ipomoea nil]